EGTPNPNPTVYYVAPNGSDTAPGTLKKPFRTIQRAADQALSGDTVYIRAGTYYETVTPPRSGTAQQPIVYASYPGEKVTISGLEPIRSSWERYAGNIYRTRTELALGSKNAVFLDGELMTPARWPNADTWLTRSPAQANNALSNATTLYPSSEQGSPALPQLNWTGAKVWMYVNWFGWTSPIQAYDSATGALTVTNNAPDDPTTLGYAGLTSPIRYYIYDSLQALDTAKEWYYDSANSTLYLYAPGGDSPDRHTVEKKSRQTALNLDHRSHIEIKGLQIVGAAIQGSGMNHVTFDGLTVRDYGFDADSDKKYASQLDVGLVLAGDGIEFRNSEIYNSSGYGLNIKGDDAVIFNNYIHDIGYAGAFTTAVSVAGHNAYIAHNTLTRTGAGCIGGNMTFGALIEYNDFSYCGMVSFDNGTMHWVKNDYQNTEIRYNNFHDGQDGAGYIYLDNASHNMIIHHNNVYNTRGDNGQAVLINHPANYIQFYDNRVDGSLRSTWGWVFQDDTYKLSVYDNVFTDGLFVSGPAEVKNNSTSPADFSLLVFPNGPAGHNFAQPPVQPAMVFSDNPWRNLVQNAGFEGMIDHYFVANDLRGWTKTGDMDAVGQLSQGESISQDKGFTRSGEGSVRLAGKSGVEQRVSGLKAGAYYEFAGWVKADAGAEALIGVKDYGGADSYEVVGDTAQGWVRKIIVFRTGAEDTAATIYLAKTSEASGYVYGDDFGLVYLGDTLPAPPPPKPGDNLLGNTGFESGDGAWNMLVNAEMTTMMPYRGVRAMRVSDGGSGVQQVSAGIAANKEMLLSAWGRKSAAGGSGLVAVRARNAAGDYINNQPEAVLTWTETVYTRKSVKFLLPAGATTVDVLFDNDGGSLFYLDEAGLREAANLIPNPGFEESNTALGYDAVKNFSIIQKPQDGQGDVYSGQRALHVTNGGGVGYGYGHTYITVGVNENTKYTLSMAGKRGAGDPGNSFVAIGYQSDKGVNVPFGCEQYTPGTAEYNDCQQIIALQWTETAYTVKSFDFTTKPGTRMIKLVIWLPGGAADLYLDEMALVEVAGVTTDPSRTEPNPEPIRLDFEQTNWLSGWQNWGGLEATADAHDGSQALHVLGTGYGGVMLTSIPVDPQRAYDLSLWAKRGDGSASYASTIGARFYDAAGTQIGGDTVLFGNITASAYTEHNKSATAPAGAVGMRIYIYMNKNVAAADLYVDDITITEALN
ncbi:MAG: hypothetical protein J7639_30225, partial [Paenibacillaceae bacterium]|nr:hypothetical protein [Paenibacillaceae bacterium]